MYQIRSFLYSDHTQGKKQKADIKALVDCGASTLFISKRFVKEKQVRTRKLMKEIPVRNIDGTSNVAGPISCFAELGLKIGDHEEEKAAFMVTDLGSDDVIIGIDWLRYHNPEIDWNAGKFALTRCPISCEKKAKRKERRLAKEKELKELEKWIEGEAEIPLNVRSISRQVTVEEITDEDEDLFIKAKASVATELAVQEAEQQKKKTFEELVPEWLHDFKKVFSEEESKRFPESKKWDHKIDFKDENDLPPNAKHILCLRKS